MGHEERLPPPRLSGCCRFGQESSPARPGTGRMRRKLSSTDDTPSNRELTNSVASQELQD
jgi:hypothetical protein